jgi:hypothetical protein
LPDINCWIKAIEQVNGKNLADDAGVAGPVSVTVRYSVANDSHKPAGPLTVVGSLFRNNVRVKPGRQPNVVPAQTITVQPGTVWVKEFTVSETNYGTASYKASILGDVGSFVNEEDEGNNLATRKFNIVIAPA